MHYAREYEIATTNTVSNPVIEPIKLSTGWIRHVSISFPPGCNRHVRCFIADGAGQILPTNLEGYYSENGYVIEIPCYFTIQEHNNTIYFIAWSVDASWNHILSILIQVEGPDEPNIYKVLNSFAQLLDRMIDLMRRVF